MASDASRATDGAPDPLPAFVSACCAYVALDRQLGDRLFARALTAHDRVIRHTIRTQLQSRPELHDDAYQEATTRLWRHSVNAPGRPMSEALMVTIVKRSAISLVRGGANRHMGVSLDELAVDPLEAAEEDELAVDEPDAREDVPDEWQPYLVLLARGQWSDGEIGMKLGVPKSTARRVCAEIRNHYRREAA